MTQEALHNCAQHSSARNIKVVVKQDGQSLRLSVEDDGKGFDPAREKGMGLLGIQERVSRLGGTFTVDSAPGAGATLRVVLPLAAAAPHPVPQSTQEVA